MEYPFKLSEIIAGCESGAWLEGSSFLSKNGNELFFIEGEFVIHGKLYKNDFWGFVKYVD